MGQFVAQTLAWRPHSQNDLLDKETELIWRMIESEGLKDCQEEDGWKFNSRRPSSLSERLYPIQIRPR